MGNFFKDLEKSLKGSPFNTLTDLFTTGMPIASSMGLQKKLGKTGLFGVPPGREKALTPGATTAAAPLVPDNTRNRSPRAQRVSAGGTPFDPLTQGPGAAQIQGALGAIPTKHVSKKKWYRKYRAWADYWRTVAQSSLGQGGFEAMDPIARLQNQLGREISEEDFVNALTADYNFDPDIRAREAGLSKYLRQQSAALGVEGAYAGIESADQRARNALASQALAAYRPQAYQAQQQFQDQAQQLLTSIAQAEFEADRATTEAGRSA
jgi:hypothetical protein